MYRVFLGAPPLSALLDIPESESNISSSQAGPPTQPTYHWQTVSSTDTAQPPHQSSYGQSNDILWGLRGEGSQSGKLERTESLIYPPATLEAASRRISIIYKNAIFDLTNVHVDGPEEEEELSGLNENNDTRAEGLGDQTTMISWPPTNSEYGSGVRPRGSLYRDPTSFLSGANEPAATSNPDITNDSRISDSGVLETQETQSFNYSDTSSISRFPTFHFNIHTISTLDQLTGSGVGPGYFRGKKHNFLLAIVEVDGPETITLKKGPDAGKQIGLLKLILGDEAGNACKLTAWRDVAEEWGGVGKAVGCKRGDVVYIENVTVECEPNMSPTLTASPNIRSKMIVCYRTMPHAHEDGIFRPDLRLGESDPCVRKVASVVRWFEGMAGLSNGGR